MLYAYAINQISEGIILGFTASLLSVTASTLSYWISRDVSDTVPVEYYLSIQCNQRMNAPQKKATDNHLKIQHSKQLTFEYSVSRSLSSSDSNHDEVAPNEACPSTEITLAEKTNFVQNRGKKWKIGKDLAEVFGIPQENIEVGHGMLNKYGLILHIVHYVYLNDLSMMEDELQSSPHALDINGITPIYFVKQLYLTFEQEINKAFIVHFKLSNDFTTTFSKSLAVQNEKHKTLLNLLAGVDNGNQETENETSKQTKMKMTMSRNSTVIKHTELSVLQRVALQATNSARQSMMNRHIEFSKQIELQPMDSRLEQTHLSVSTHPFPMRFHLDNPSDTLSIRIPNMSSVSQPPQRSASNTPTMQVAESNVSMKTTSQANNKRYRLKITDIDFSEKIKKEDVKSLTPPEIVKSDTNKIDEKYGDAAKNVGNNNEVDEGDDDAEMKEVEHMVTQTLSSITSAVDFGDRVNGKITGIDSANSGLSTIDEEDGDEHSKESLDLA